jgi:hypothetical protein
VEGWNILGLTLWFLGVLVLGVTPVVALGLRIAGRTRGALLTFAGGLLGTAVIAALATLSDLEWGRPVSLSERCREAALVTVALSLLLAGAGQFIAALRIRASYGVAFGWGAGSMVLLVVSFPGAESVRGVHYQIVGGVNLRLALSLLLAALCLLSAVVSSRKKTAALLCTALGGFGFVAGFAVADACVTTRCTLGWVRAPDNIVLSLGEQGFLNSRRDLVRVEVNVLGKRVSDWTGVATVAISHTPSDGTWVEEVRAGLPAEAAWVFGPVAAGAGAGAATGLVVGWVIARLLARKFGQGIQAQP